MFFKGVFSFILLFFPAFMYHIPIIFRTFAHIIAKTLVRCSTQVAKMLQREFACSCPVVVRLLSDCCPVDVRYTSGQQVKKNRITTELQMDNNWRKGWRSTPLPVTLQKFTVYIHFNRNPLSFRKKTLSLQLHYMSWSQRVRLNVP